uniref:Uncharacterized protein n=1 Tax=Romanomermis culicivorax TaxID=13658 RepID=A0A915IR01_ROMCU
MLIDDLITVISEVQPFASTPMALHSMVYAMAIKNLTHLKNRIQSCWKKLPQPSITLAIDQFCITMRLFVAEEGPPEETRLLMCQLFPSVTVAGFGREIGVAFLLSLNQCSVLFVSRQTLVLYLTLSHPQDSLTNN